MPEERRKFTRIDSRLISFYKVVSTGKVRRAMTKNIGGGGLCFVTETLFEPSTELEVEVRLPDYANLIYFSAEVVWSRPLEGAHKRYDKATAETGIKILNIDPEEHKLLTQHVKINAQL